MSFEIKQATRQSVKPLCGLYSESGAGKTYSALMLARGLVGPSGKVLLADTESGRGSLYADILPGGYNTVEIREPFSPSRCIEVIQLAEKNCDVLILDSASHFWEGIGSVCDMAAEIEGRTGKTGLHVWREPKLQHQKMMLKLLQASIPIIVCLRAKYKTRQTKENGKTVIVKDDVISPIQSEDFVFELTCHGFITSDHAFHPTKISHPALGACFPNGKPIEIRHGELLRAWCEGGSKQAAPVKPSTPTAPTSAKEATEATRQWALKELSAYGDVLHSYLEQCGWIMPNEEVTDIPLSKVPTSKQALHELMGKIEAFRESGSV